MFFGFCLGLFQEKDHFMYTLQAKYIYILFPVLWHEIPSIQKLIYW